MRDGGRARKVMNRLTRAGLLALALPSLYAAILMMTPQGGTAAALLALKPGPIDHPQHLVAADFNQDGYDDLAIANFEAGTVTILINQGTCSAGAQAGEICIKDLDCPGGGTCKYGTFFPHKDSPNLAGGATVGNPTGGPLFLVTGDLDPEDVDGDEVTNLLDNCPNVYNPADSLEKQADADGNGVGDACQIDPTVDTDGDGKFDYDADPTKIDNCPRIYNPGQEPERAAGLDGICGTADDNVFLYESDGSCGTKTSSKVGAACSRSADLAILDTSSGGGSPLGLVRVRVNDGTGGLKSRNSVQADSGLTQGVLADYNNDHRLDVVVSNSSTDALLLFPGADNGQIGGVCFGGSSVGRSCTNTTQCPGGTCKQTQVLLTAGECKGGSSNGATCATSSNCQGGGTCRLVASPGTVATCLGGSVQGKICTRDADCPGGGICRTPVGPEGVAVADVDDDTFPDLAFANRIAHTVGVLHNDDGTGLSPVSGSPFQTQDPPAYILAGSLDGKQCKGGPTPGASCSTDTDCGSGGTCHACDDLVVLEQGPLTCHGGSKDGTTCSTNQQCIGGGACGSGTIQVFTSTCSTGSLGAGQTIDLGLGHVPRGGTLVDFDGDGHLDLAVVDFIGNEVLLFAGAGTGQFTPVPPLSGPSSPAALVPLNIVSSAGPKVDLAVLGFADNRVELYRNSSSPGDLKFDVIPGSPASPWRDVSAMALFAADASPGFDLTLLTATPPRFDVLSGTGTTFRALTPEPLSGPTRATGMTVADLRQDGLLDILVLDATVGNATPLISDQTGAQTERLAVSAGAGAAQAFVAPLTLHAGDYDQDGVPNKDDNCPTRYNPPGCPANDKDHFPQCFVDIPCTSLAESLRGACTTSGAACTVDLDCGPTGGTCDICRHRNLAGQCDNDNDGIGDQCEILTATCKNIDTDGDTVPDYDQITNPRKIDNCPWIANPDQADSDKTCSVSGATCTADADCGTTGGQCKGDGIGDLCDGSRCDDITDTCRSGPKANASCLEDADCDAPVNDAVVADATGGTLSFLIGDASGSFRKAPGSWSAIGGLANPVAAAIDRFTYNDPCRNTFGELKCDSDPRPDILVAESGAPGSSDDVLKLYSGDGLGGFTPPSPPVQAQVPLQGDPTHLLVAPDQSVCPNPWLLITDPRYHFDADGKTSVIAVLEPGTSTVAIYLPSNEGPAPPPGNPSPPPPSGARCASGTSPGTACTQDLDCPGGGICRSPLPLPSPPGDATFVDLNQDGYLDLVVLSPGDGDPTTPNVIVYIGLGNGLFFSDPSLNSTDVPDGMTFLAAGHVKLVTYPDLVLFDGVNREPVIMTNALTDRADIDHSGRVDGYDLALLARAFGAERPRETHATAS
ncbi:MAG: hypothetical protein DMF52_09300 [Acidobacteria bacterium]|nr:MAG: hypothetical protein DMF52_09300 [Acidobacteriota bacterium]